MEIVVADNNSTDRTSEVVAAHRARLGRVVHSLQANKCRLYEGLINAIRNASGEFVVFLADDDSLVDAALVRYVRRLEATPDLVAVFADWVAYDDENEREIHRYFQFREPATFGPGQPMEYVNFVLQHIVYPEMCIMRRSAILQADCLGKRTSYGAHRWAYQLRRLGRVAFELDPFYRETRVVKSRFRRGVPDNMLRRLQTLGDEMRNELETILLWAVQDSGQRALPADQVLNAKNLIDRYLNSRIPLEIQRSIAERDWLLALDLRRREVLWSGPGDDALRRRDALEISLPAALQAVRDVYQYLAGVEGLLLEGFETNYVESFFRQAFPEVRLASPGMGMRAPPARHLVLRRNAPQGAPADGYSMALDVLLRQYAVGDAIDLRGL